MPTSQPDSRAPHGLEPIAVRAAAPATVRVPGATHGLSWRPLSRTDVPGLTALLTAIESADEEPTRTSSDEVDEKFDGTSKDLERDTLAGVDDDGVLRAWAFVTQPDGDTNVVRAFLDGGVHPQWRGRGIGHEVLAWQLDRGRQLLAASGKDVPGRLAAYASQQATATVALLQAGGLAPRRVYCEMRRPLDVPLPAVEPPAGVRIVAWSPERDDETRLAHNEAFASHWGSEPRSPQSWQEGRSHLAPEWSLLALDERTDEIAGYLVAGRYEQDWAVAGRSSGYVELLGVRPAWRRRGIAPALLVAFLHRLRTDGIACAELGVDTENLSGALGLYTSLGFAPFHRASLYSIEL